MPVTGLKAFDTTIEKTNLWLKEIMADMGTEDLHRAYLSLAVVLHALRDRLPIEEAIQLGAQLPMLIRGLFYDGWDPGCQPIKHDKASFLQYIRSHFPDEPNPDAESASRAVFKVLAMRITEGEIKDIKNILPKDLRELWEQSYSQTRC